MHQRRLRFRSGQLHLEGILTLPRGTGPFPAVVVCHPHPLHGGSMDNNVVRSLCQALARVSLVSFRFNFRGVGDSEGEFDHGIGEEEDVKAAVSFISGLKEVDSSRLGLAGYSAGAAFALPVGSRDERIRALAAVSPPLTMFDFGFLKGCHKPEFLISGTEDDFTPVERFLELCSSLTEPKEYQTIEGADHFWWGHESSLATEMADFFTESL